MLPSDDSIFDALRQVLSCMREKNDSLAKELRDAKLEIKKLTRELQGCTCKDKKVTIGSYEYTVDEVLAVIGALAEDIRRFWPQDTGDGRFSTIRMYCEIIGREDLINESYRFEEYIDKDSEHDGRYMREFSVYGGEKYKKYYEKGNPKWKIFDDGFFMGEHDDE